MKNVKLSTKLMSAFLFVACITLIVGFFGWRGASKADDALDEVADVRLPSVLGLEIMNEAQTAVQRAESSLLVPEFFNSTEERRYQHKMLKEAWERAEQGWKLYEPLPQTEEEAQIWARFKPAWEAWKREHRKVIDLVEKESREEAMALFTGDSRKTFLASEKLLLDLIDLNVRVADEFKKVTQRQSHQARIIASVGAVVGPVLALLLGITLTLSITRPIARVVHELAGASDQVAAASNQVSSASQQLAEGASQQAAALEETSSSLEEMTSMITQNAQNATQVDHVTREARQVAEKANRSMAALTASMQATAHASEETQKIIRTIDEIAFQTNLLALNAAVEAARAGEAGAGFAVVADEVRNLAMRAAEAAKTTEGLIEDTVKRVKAETELVGKTNADFISVSSCIQKAGQLIGEISAASQEQAQGITQINKAVAELDKVTQQNAANAEESASASEEMNAQAEQIRGFALELEAVVGGDGRRKAMTGHRRDTERGISTWRVKADVHG